MTTVQVTVPSKLVFIFVNSTSVCSNYCLSITHRNALPSRDLDHDTYSPQSNTNVLVATKHTGNNRMPFVGQGLLHGMIHCSRQHASLKYPLNKTLV